MIFNILASNKNWHKYSLEEICLKVTSGGTPSRKNPKLYENGNINWVKTKELNNGYIWESEEKITEEAVRKSSAKLLPVNTILLAMYGATVGELGVLGKEMACNQACCALIIDPKKADYRFIFYLLRLYKKEIQSLATGAAQQNLSAKTIKEFCFYIPSLEKQTEIADILSELDKKIQLNTQINQTLEQIAQALFKSWFVDFDPVRAKVQALSDGLSLEQAELAVMQTISGKTPEELTALSQTQPDRYAELAETAKAFPCEMVEVDGVEVPKGWRIGTFTDITESRREKVKNDKAMVLSAVSSGELVKSEEYFTKQVFSKSIDKYLKVYKWDFAYNPARINIGSIGLHEADYLGAVSPVYEVFSVSDKYHWFLKRILNLETTKIKIQSLCTGSVRQTLKLKDFQSIDCVIPDEKTLSIFNKKWEEYRTLILENNKNTQTLSEIRDLLLPRLLSGKIEND